MIPFPDLITFYDQLALKYQKLKGNKGPTAGDLVPGSRRVEKKKLFPSTLNKDYIINNGSSYIISIFRKKKTILTTYLIQPQISIILIIRLDCYSNLLFQIQLRPCPNLLQRRGVRLWPATSWPSTTSAP